MAVSTVCPACLQRYQLSEEVRGKRVRCRQCSGTFVVEEQRAPVRAPAEIVDYDDPQEAAPRRARESSENGEPRPRRRKGRRKQDNTAMIIMIVGGGVTAMAIVVAAIAVWWFMGSKKNDAMGPVAQGQQPPFTPPPMRGPQGQPPANNQPNNPPPNNTQPNNPPPADNQGQGQARVTLSNAKMSKALGARMELSVDYRFDNGAPIAAGPDAYFLIIKPVQRFNVYEARLNTLQFRGNQGTLNVSGISFGDVGPYEVYMEKGSFVGGPFSPPRDKVSNTLRVEAEIGVGPGAGMPPFGRGGRRGPNR